MSDSTRKSQRARRIKNGKYVRGMNAEEREVYEAACKRLGVEPKSPTTREAHSAAGAEGNNSYTDNGTVLQLFGEEKNTTNRAGIVPEGGNADGTVDHRKRYNMKYAGRLGKRWSEIIQNVKDGEYTWEEFVNALSPEELAKGQIKDKNGSFSGRPPSFVPRAFHDACVRELLARGKVLYKENYVKAIEAMTKIANGEVEGTKPADRIKAATFVIERLEGKVPERLEISAADPWQEAIAGIVAEAEDEQIARAQEYLSRRPEGADGG